MADSTSPFWVKDQRHTISLCSAAAMLLTPAAYFMLRTHVCSHCNRLGNFLDSWYQLNLMVELGHGAGTDSRHCDLARTVEQHDQCERATWRHAAGAMRMHLEGVGIGISLRQLLRNEPRSGSLAVHTYRQSASQLPPPSFWLSTEGRVLIDQLRVGDIRFHFWSNLHVLQPLMPYLRSSLHALVQSFKSAVVQQEHQREGICIIHYRASDFLEELHDIDPAADAAAIVAAVRTMPTPPKRFELLDGGITQHLCAGECGSSFTQILERALRRAFSHVAIARVIGGTPDEDFVRMATARMLIIGGGSYATFAALASSGEVRMPRCVLRFGEEGPCTVDGATLLPGLVTYAHPRCTCLCEFPPCWKNITNATDHYKQILRNQSKGMGVIKSRIFSWAPLVETKNAQMLRAYALPAQERSELLRAVVQAEGIYLTPPARPTAYAATLNAVLLTSFNLGAFDLYLNWACHTRRLGLRHLVWSQDWTTMSHLAQRPDLGSVGEEGVAGKHASLFFSAHAARVLSRASWGATFRRRSWSRRRSGVKLLAIMNVLLLDRDVWFCDVDVVVLRDPWPLFARATPRFANVGGHLVTVSCDYEYIAKSQCDAHARGGGRATRQRHAVASSGSSMGFHLFVTGYRSRRLIQEALDLSQRQPSLADSELLRWAIRMQLNASIAVDVLRNATDGQLWFSPPPPPPPPSPPPALQSLHHLDKSALDWARPPPPPPIQRALPLTLCALPHGTHVTPGACTRTSTRSRAAVVQLKHTANMKARLARAGLWAVHGHGAEASCTGQRDG